MNIRAMLEQDLEQVCAIECDNFSMPWSRQSFLDVLQKSNYIYLVAEQQQQVLGYCGIWNIVGEGQITNVSVGRAFQRQGVASALLCACLEKGRDMGITAYTLEVRESNSGAIALYEKFGFKQEGVRKNFYEKPKEHAIIMWKHGEHTIVDVKERCLS